MPHVPKPCIFLVAACCIGCAPAAADPEQPPPRVVVSSLKDPYRIAYRNIQKALTAQHDNPLLAPQARTRWMLFAKDGTPVTAPSSIAIAGSTGQLPIAQDSAGGFELPATLPDLGDDVELRIGVKRGDVNLVPVVETDGTDASRRRLGDLRLECEMTWRLEYDDIPLLARAAIKLVGSPCGSKNFGVPVHAGRRLQSASIVRDGRPVELKLALRGKAFYAPLYDSELGNDTPVTLEFRRADP